MPRLRLVILISGRGSNMESLIRASQEQRMDADVALVVSNKPDAKGLGIAQAMGIATEVVPSTGLDKDAHEALLRAAVEKARPDYVLLAGYMRILGPAFVAAFRGRILNIHPSLLPAFTGLDAQAQAHAKGARIAGCTTHFVTEALDAGPIVMQAAIAVPPGTTADELRARILDAEHRLYPATVQLLATGKARLEGDRVVYAGVEAPGGVLLSPVIE